jgi:hypothetical protein
VRRILIALKMQRTVQQPEAGEKALWLSASRVARVRSTKACNGPMLPAVARVANQTKEDQWFKVARSFSPD